MIGLLVTQCLIQDITHCRQVKVPVLNAATIARCYDLAPMAINEFGKQYSTWFIRTYECQDIDKKQDEKT